MYKVFGCQPFISNTTINDYRKLRFLLFISKILLQGEIRGKIQIMSVWKNFRFTKFHMKKKTDERMSDIFVVLYSIGEKLGNSINEFDLSIRYIRLNLFTRIVA